MLPDSSPSSNTLTPSLTVKANETATVLLRTSAHFLALLPSVPVRCETRREHRGWLSRPTSTPNRILVFFLLVAAPRLEAGGMSQASSAAATSSTSLTPPNGRAQANDVGAGSIGAGGAGRGNRGGWYDGDDDDDASGDGARRGDVDGAPAGA